MTLDVWKQSRLDQEDLFPEMRCQRKVVDDLTRRGKVLKARMVDGKLLWVREQSQKENP